MSASRRWIAFIGVGALGFAWQIAALGAMTHLAGVPYPLAAALAVELAILHNFVWHERWTWRDRQTSSMGAALARLVRFNGASGVQSIAGNVLLTTLFVEALQLPVVGANVAAVLLMSGVNFAVADRFVFRATRQLGLGLTILALLGTPALAGTSDLQPETVAAFDRYIRLTEARLLFETTGDAPFLSVDFESPQEAAALRGRLRRGEVVATIVESPADVPSGMIHHWRGYIFITGVTVDDMLAAVRSPGAHRQQDVLAARVTRRWPGGHLLFLKLRRTGIVTVTYNTEHVVTYARDAQGRATSRSVSQRIAELDAPEPGQEREKPVGRDRGFLWRMNSYWRYEPVEDGVIVQLDSITLSRDLPWGIATIAHPIISRVARESVSRTLASLRERFMNADGVRMSEAMRPN